MVFAVTIGCIIGVLLAFFLARRLLTAMSAWLAGADSRHRDWIFRVGGVFGTLVLAPSIFMAVIVGGYMSGRQAAAIEAVIGEGDGRLFLALAFGIVLVTSITVTGAAAVGGWFGHLFARSLAAGRPT
jgi:hypothetical protein